MKGMSCMLGIPLNRDAPSSHEPLKRGTAARDAPVPNGLCRSLQLQLLMTAKDAKDAKELPLAVLRVLSVLRGSVGSPAIR